VTDFLDLLDAPDPPPVVLLDRSLLDDYSQCPFKGHAKETKLVEDISDEALSGQHAHDVIAALVQAVVDQSTEPVADALIEAQMSRPDLQPDVLAAVRWSLRDIFKYLYFVPVDEWPQPRRNPADILRYDGGKGERCSQLAWDILPGTRLTSELDLVMAGPDAETLDETDWKTGHTIYNATGIAYSFQFQMHAALVFHSYPGCQTLRVRVWHTRFNSVTGWAVFKRERLPDLEGRLLTTVQAREQAFKAVANGGQPDTWPSMTKCERCPARHVCPRVTAPAWRIMDDPAEDAKTTDVMQIEVDKRWKTLTEHAIAQGAPIDLGGGEWYGLKPTKARKPTAASYGRFSAKPESED